MVEKFMIEKSGVEKSGVEKSGFEKFTVEKFGVGKSGVGEFMVEKSGVEMFFNHCSCCSLVLVNLFPFWMVWAENRVYMASCICPNGS
jgi:hypothetical protein